MTFFNDSVPPLRRKQAIPDAGDMKGLVYVNWQIGGIKLYTNFYTRVDQAFIIWSLLLIPMFVTAQFFPVSWSWQAIIWSVLSIVGTVAMIVWTSYWVKYRQVIWILYSWAVLMLAGVIFTDLGVFLGWTEILLNLCPMWLGLTAIGYFLTGLAVRSRTLLAASILHFSGIFVLPYFIGWQFLITGALMIFCLLILAEFDWDHQ